MENGQTVEHPFTFDIDSKEYHSQNPLLIEISLRVCDEDTPPEYKDDCKTHHYIN